MSERVDAFFGRAASHRYDPHYTACHGAHESVRERHRAHGRVADAAELGRSRSATVASSISTADRMLGSFEEAEDLLQ